MTELDPTMSDDFRHYAELILDHHFLLQRRKEDLATADVEDQMDAIWPRLGAVQQQSLNGMASDLNWIRRKGEPPPKGRKTPIEVGDQEQAALDAAMGARQWHSVLHYLRLCAPLFAGSSLAQERKNAYDAIGLPRYAQEFGAMVATLNSRTPLKQGDVVLVDLNRQTGAEASELAPKNEAVVWDGGVKYKRRSVVREALSPQVYKVVKVPA